MSDLSLLSAAKRTLTSVSPDLDEPLRNGRTNIRSDASPGKSVK
jgi:hypothetical protein